MGNDSISRRQVLRAVAGAGVLGAGVGGTAGMLTDGESVDGVSVAAGSLDLETCWTHDDCDRPLSIVVGPDAGSTGSETVEYRLPEYTNPAYLHVRTTCPPEACGLADRLELTVSDGPCGRAGRTLERGRLCDVLSALRAGTALADGRAVDAGETRCLDLEWSLEESLEEDASVEIGVEFHATQARNVANAAAVAPWEGATCAVDCAETSDCDDPPTGRDISWVGFCAESGTTIRDEDLDFEVDGDTLTLQTAPDSLATVLLKHGPALDVFRDAGPGTFVTGGGDDTYEQQGSAFPDSETDPPRSNPRPCPGRSGLKYEGDFETPSDGGDRDA
ncbi:hypothetical protein [Halorientalis halophila]|uniref:hypothetical protein n=1 Tax=Halorientalis halophila TaxID=3108499 RepID=UPI00300AB928